MHQQEAACCKSMVWLSYKDKWEEMKKYVMLWAPAAIRTIRPVTVHAKHGGTNYKGLLYAKELKEGARDWLFIGQERRGWLSSLTDGKPRLSHHVLGDLKPMIDQYRNRGMEQQGPFKLEWDLWVFSDWECYINRNHPYLKSTRKVEGGLEDMWNECLSATGSSVRNGGITQ